MNILFLENKFEKSKFKTLYRTSQSTMDSIYDSIPLMKIESSAKFRIPAKMPCIMTHDGTQIKRYNLLR